MNNYICLNDAIEEIARRDFTDGTIKCFSGKEIIEILHGLSHHEIFRCHECKHSVHSGNGDRYICTVSPKLRTEHEADFYCGYAERRE